MIGPEAMPAIVRDSVRVIAADLGFRTGVLANRVPPGTWLRGHILFLDLGWFGFTRSGILQQSVAAGQPVLRIRPPRPPVLPALENWPKREATHGAVRLWEICEYELCMKYDCSLDALEHRVASEPAPDKAASDTFQSARWLIDWSIAALDFYRPRVVMLPQGYVLPAAAMRAAALARGLRVVALENTFRNDRICWDDIKGITLSSPIPMRMFATSRVKRGEDYFFQYRASARTLKSRQHSTVGAGATPRFDGRKILFIGQVNTDSSVLFHIKKGFSDQMSAVNAVADYTIRSNDSTLLLKVHPKEVRGRDPLGRRYSLERYKQFHRRKGVADCDRIHVDDRAEIDIITAIEWADLCVTINSQAGLEAAALGKPVILCGDANYIGLRSIRRVNSPKELISALDNPSPPADASEARQFFFTYCEEYCRKTRARTLIELAGPTSPYCDAKWTMISLFLWPFVRVLSLRNSLGDTAANLAVLGRYYLPAIHFRALREVISGSATSPRR